MDEIQKLHADLDVSEKNEPPSYHTCSISYCPQPTYGPYKVKLKDGREIELCRKHYFEVKYPQA